MKETNKRTTGIIIGAVIAVAILLMCFAGYKAVTGAQAGSKTVTITVVTPDGVKNQYAYRTDAQYLGEVLQNEKLAEGTMGDYGLYITTVAGVTADETKEQWWCITKDGESVNTGADTTPVADGDKFELTLTEGYGQ